VGGRRPGEWRLQRVYELFPAPGRSAATTSATSSPAASSRCSPSARAPDGEPHPAAPRRTDGRPWLRSWCRSWPPSSAAWSARPGWRSSWVEQHARLALGAHVGRALVLERGPGGAPRPPARRCWRTARRWGGSFGVALTARGSQPRPSSRGEPVFVQPRTAMAALRLAPPFCPQQGSRTGRRLLRRNHPDALERTLHEMSARTWVGGARMARKGRGPTGPTRTRSSPAEPKFDSGAWMWREQGRPRLPGPDSGWASVHSCTSRNSSVAIGSPSASTRSGLRDIARPPSNGPAGVVTLIRSGPIPSPLPIVWQAAHRVLKRYCPRSTSGSFAEVCVAPGGPHGAFQPRKFPIVMARNRGVVHGGVSASTGRPARCRSSDWACGPSRVARVGDGRQAELLADELDVLLLAGEEEPARSDVVPLHVRLQHFGRVPLRGRC